jgi:hypothetical protein
MAVIKRSGKPATKFGWAKFGTGRFSTKKIARATPGTANEGAQGASPARGVNNTPDEDITRETL